MFANAVFLEIRMHEGAELCNAKKCSRKLNSRSGSVILAWAACAQIAMILKVFFSLIFYFFIFLTEVQPLKEKLTNVLL